MAASSDDLVDLGLKPVYRRWFRPQVSKYHCFIMYVNIGSDGRYVLHTSLSGITSYVAHNTSPLGGL